MNQSKPLFWPNLQLWVILSHIGVKLFEKVGKLKKIANVHPLPMRNEIFWDFPKNEMLWWKKMGKVVNWVKLTILSQSQPHFGGKDRKSCKMIKFGHFDPI